MCIIFLYHALGGDPADGRNSTRHEAPSGLGGRYKLIVASNRDEFRDRASAPLHFWTDAGSDILAGRDLLAGGTWLGLSRSGKLAVITNSPSEWDNYLTSIAGRVKSIVLRSAAVMAAASAAAVASRRQENGGVAPLGLLCAAGAVAAGSVGLAVAVTMATRRSRGALVTDFLEGKEDARTYSTRLAQDCWRYAGFNLVLVDPDSAWSVSNKTKLGALHLPRGFYGLSNVTLDTPNAKMVYGKSRMLQVLLRMAADPNLAEDALVELLMDVLADETPCPLSENESSSHKPWWWRAIARVCVPMTPAPASLWASWPWQWTRSRPSSSSSSSTMRLYGTRTSTVVLIDASGRTRVVERNLGDETGASMRDAEGTSVEFCNV